jgi:hypothetical protein
MKVKIVKVTSFFKKNEAFKDMKEGSVFEVIDKEKMSIVCNGQAVSLNKEEYEIVEETPEEKWEELKAEIYPKIDAITAILPSYENQVEPPWVAEMRSVRGMAYR